MRVLMVTPRTLDDEVVSGNGVTVERWRRSLTARGLVVSVVAAAKLPRGESPAWDLVHVHHAWKSGGPVLADPSLAALPRVVSLPGTDLTADLRDPERRGTVEAVLRGSRVLVVQSAAMAADLDRLLPELSPRVRVVGKGHMWLGSEPFDVRLAAGAGPGDLLFLVPVGIRPVKNPLAFLDAVATLRRERPVIRALVVGPVLDEAYAESFREAVEGLGGAATWLPGISPGAMRAAYEGSDVVVLPSLHEGMANVLLEACAAGRPLLVSDAPSSRAFVEEAGIPCGLVFRRGDDAGLVAAVLRLTDDEALRTGLARAARERYEAGLTPEREAEGLERVYREVLGQAAG